jgi:hypothetical protein
LATINIRASEDSGWARQHGIDTILVDDRDPSRMGFRWRERCSAFRGAKRSAPKGWDLSSGGNAEVTSCFVAVRPAA